MNALILHRIAHYFYKRKIPLLPMVFQALIFFLFNSYVPYQVRIGAGSRFGHRGIGVVLNKDSRIGCNVLIRAHVTIGKKTSDGMAPVIEDDVEIGDGAKIIGDVTVGKGAVIGANAVVVKDVPSYALAVGVPAKIIEKKT